MDKETLSNYGWIVICVLVLAVMLALATPFGTFIADGFKATYTGLFQTGDNALDVGLSAVGVSNKLPCGHGRKEAGDHSQKECGHFACNDCGCTPASCGVEGHWSGDGMDHTTKVSHTNTSKYTNPHMYACQCTDFSVPEGGTYTKYPSTVYASGEKLPCGFSPSQRDIYSYGDYTYSLAETTGWNVSINTAVTDKNQKTYGPIMDEIFGKPTISLNSTFNGCSLLETAPEIPSTVTSLQNAFYGCTSMTSILFTIS